MGCNLYAYCGNNPVTRSDGEGDSWKFAAVCALVGGVVGFASKVLSNKATGRKWNDGLLGATVGGIVGGAVFGATYDSTTAAAFAGAFAESVTNEVGSYCPTVGKYNGQSQRKKISSTNIMTSGANVGYDTVLGGGVALLTGGMAEVVIPSVEQTNQIKSFAASFFDDYAKNVHNQTVLQACFDTEIDMIEGIAESMGAGQLQQDAYIMLYSKE